MSKFGLKVATHLYEDGIVSNRGLARHGELFWGLAHTARHVKEIKLVVEYNISINY